MTTAETITTAIDKLTQLRAIACGTEPWEASPEGVTSAGHPVVELEGGGCAYWSDGDRDLVVTLHATIDAQLAILRHALVFVHQTRGAASHEGPSIDLARAILGEDA